MHIIRARIFKAKSILILAGAMIGIAGSVALRHFGTPPPPPPPPLQQQEEERRREMAWRIIAPRLEIAGQDAAKCAEMRTQQVADFFAERQKRVPAFAERALSFSSKWKLAKSATPWGDKEAHQRFLKQEFDRLVFSDAELSEAVTLAVKEYARDIQAIENALLVNIRADLQDVPESAAVLPDLRSDEAFRERFLATVAESVSRQTAVDARVDIGRFVGSEIAVQIVGRLGARLAARLGVSGTILGVGAAFGPETFGGSIVLGLIADQLAGRVIGLFYDPESEIAGKLCAELDRLSSLIIQGDGRTPGLRQELADLGRQRTMLRNAALKEMVLTSSR